jgi:hypothetical protein
MTLRVVIDAPAKLDLAEDLLEEFHGAAIEAVEDAAQLLLDEIVRVLRLRQGSAETAAPAGEPPEQDTGALAASFRLLPGRVRGAVAFSGIRSNHPGANRLEWGFTDIRGIRTLPHPFIMRSVRATEGPINALLKQRLS